MSDARQDKKTEKRRRPRFSLRCFFGFHNRGSLTTDRMLGTIQTAWHWRCTRCNHTWSEYS